MSEREKILGRIREALRVEAPFPGTHGGHSDGAHAHIPRPASTHAREWLPAVPESPEARMELFAACCADLKADLELVAAPELLPETLQRLRDRHGWKRAATHNGELTFRATQGLGIPILMADGGYDVHQLEACDVGITECDALVAQTGSVLITSRSSGGRALSVLPPHHVVVARRDQLVADLPAAFELLARRHAWNYPSFISLVTGPSRTGDIERILVLGAHGPKQLTIVCV